MKFNMNDPVRIRLTDFGKQHLKNIGQEWRLTDGYSNTETGGVSEWQLWDLAATFGSVLRNGGQVPFDLMIEIPDTPTK